MTDLLPRDFKPALHNDISIDEEAIYKKHKAFLNRKEYSAATALLRDSQTDGIRASVFNTMENKLLLLSEALDKQEFTSPYYYSSSADMPTDEEFKSKTIWSQYYNN